MIGIDTNVLVRYLVQDDPRQSSKATAFVETLSAEEPGYLTLVALVETTWVLAVRYAVGRAGIADVVGSLLASREIRVERPDVVRQALQLFVGSTADFADCLIASGGLAAGCEHTVTFDAKAARMQGMVLAG